MKPMWINQIVAAMSVGVLATHYRLDTNVMLCAAFICWAFLNAISDVVDAIKEKKL